MLVMEAGVAQAAWTSQGYWAMHQGCGEEGSKAQDLLQKA